MIAYICTDTKCCGWADTIKPQNMLCPLCNKNVEARMMVKPWGFTSVNGKEIPESIDDQRYSSTGTPSYASLPMTDKMTIISANTKVEPRKEQTMTIINKGPLQCGFKLCRKCGAIVPSIDFEDNDDKDKEIKRPYKVPYQKDDQQKCSHDWTDTYLGYKFTTDIFVLEIHLDNNTLNLTDRRIWLYSAIKTFAEAFALSSAKVLDIEFTDIKSGYRIRNYNNELYVDIYIYDNITSGAGYSNQIANVLNDVFDDMEIRLGKCNCEKSCPKCVHHFWNQTSQNDLNRKRGLELLLWIRYNKLRKKIENFNQCVESIKNITSLCEPQLRFEYNNNEIHIIYQNIKKKVFIYPSMLSQNFLPNNIIAIPDTFCVESPAKVWEKIKTIFD